MKTCLYTTSYLTGTDFTGTDRLWRTLRYLFWYETLQDDLGYQDIHMVDDGSEEERIKMLEHFPNLTVHRLPKMPRRGIGEHDYPFCWRGVYWMKNLIDMGYEKIIRIDTDGFILTRRLTDWVRNTNTGWQTLTPKEHYFPEDALNVLNKDAFDVYLKFIQDPPETHYGKILELTLPFTKVTEEFSTFRWGQTNTPQAPGMDLYAQAHHKIKLRYEK